MATNKLLQLGKNRWNWTDTICNHLSARTLITMPFRRKIQQQCTIRPKSPPTTNASSSLPVLMERKLCSFGYQNKLYLHSTCVNRPNIKELFPSKNSVSLAVIPTRSLHRTDVVSTADDDNSESLGKITPKFYLAFTCKVCGERVKKTISRQAYEKGVVIVKCHGCDNNHLIADNMDWFKGAAKGKNIEEIMAEKGETVTRSMNDDDTLEITEKNNSL